MQFANVSRINWFHASLFLLVSGLWLAVMYTLYPIGLDCEAVLAILGDKYRRQAIHTYAGFRAYAVVENHRLSLVGLL
jgi:hypothetical protein